MKPSSPRPLPLVALALLLWGCPPSDDNNKETTSPEQDQGMNTTMMDQGTTPDQSVEDPDMGTQNPDQGETPDQDERPDQAPDMPLPTDIDGAQDQRRDLLAELLCDIVTGCPELDYDFIQVRGRYASREVCEASILEDFGLNSAETSEQVSIASKRALFDLDAAQQCITTLRELAAADTCADPDTFLEGYEQSRCEQFVSGVVPDGGDCLVSSDCAGENAYCDDFDTPDNDACLGKCYAFDIPETCDPECGENQRCDVDTLMCVPLSGPMGACDFSSDCEDTLFCGYDEMTGEGTCQARAAIEETCNFDLECVQQAYCDYGEDKPVCVALKQAGEACTEYGQCVEGSFCDPPDDENAPRVCVEPVDVPRVVNVVGMGEPCGLTGNPLDLCEVGLACVGLELDADGNERGTCGAARGAGESCVEDSECVFPLVCGDQETCEMFTLIADGQDCEYDFECESGYCDPSSYLCASSSMCVYTP